MRPIKIFDGTSKFSPYPKKEKVIKPKYNLKAETAKKKPSKSVLMAMRDVCDKLFSKWIKVRDCANGKFVCITCGKSFYYKKAQCGHFIKRGENAVRFDERNSQAQCGTCNGHQASNGFQFLHGIAIDRIYGKGTADELKALSKQPFKLDRLELEKLIEKFKI